jgi:2-dehydro-3-deoxyphosphogluconate aldolase/(4S)-4-hydroxy-2-oxoglutarate aldolase
MTPFSFLSALRISPFLGILRGVETSHLPHIAQVAKAAQLDFIEITMNTKGAVDLIRILSKLCKPLNIEVGAGTVRTLDDLHMAIDAGAEFIVSPSCNPAIIDHCARHGMPCLPGALTPTEIQTAFDAGATCIKVFPAKVLGGPAYFKELRGPFHDIPLLACGGVDTHNAAEYFASGADALAFGSSIFRPEWLVAGEWEKVISAIKKLRESTGK